MQSPEPLAGRVVRPPSERMAMVDLELSAPLPALVGGGDAVAGVAILGRVHGRPILFTICRLPPGTPITREVLGRILAAKGEDVIAEALRREIRPPLERAPVDLTIAICTRARTADLARCLASVSRLAAADRAHARRLEVLVIDNAPPDESTREVVDAHAEARYVREDRPGLDFARNAALRHARGEFIAYVDDDVELDEGWLAGLQEAIAENPDASAVTGLVVARELASRAQVVFELRGGFRRGFRKARFRVDSVPEDSRYPIGAGIFGAGANMAFRREALLALGGFDEALDTGPPLPGGGDLDVFYRLVRSGRILVYEPRMLAFHRHRASMTALRRQYASWGRGYMAFLAKVYAAEPDQRPACRHMLRWWTVNQLRHIAKSCRRSTPWSPVLPLAELWGGVVGLAGTYPRSQRRAEEIRRSHA